MHIRSPAIDTVADSIFYIATDGGAYISDYISTYSYGRRSPCFEHDRNNAGYFIFLTGHVFGNWEVAVTDYYGSPGTVPIPVSLIWVTSSGNTDSFGGLSYSYGTIRSRVPIVNASFVTFNGEVGGRANGDFISHSYG